MDGELKSTKAISETVKLDGDFVDFVVRDQPDVVVGDELQVGVLREEINEPESCPAADREESGEERQMIINREDFIHNNRQTHNELSDVEEKKASLLSELLPD